MRLVIYVSYIPLNKKIARDWYVNYLLDVPEVNVKFWDISYLLRGQLNEQGEQKAEYAREIRDFPELERAVAMHRDAVFVLLLPKIWKYRRVFRLLSQHNCKTAVVKWGGMPDWGYSSRNGLLQWMLSPRVLLSKIRNRVHAFILRQSWYVQPYEVVFAAGQVMLSRSEATRRLVPIGFCDFEQYVLSKLCERVVDKKYALFLDNYLPFHSDLKLVGMHPLNPQTYYAELDRFFALAEQKYGLEVVISAHPKARYSKNEFRGRKVIADKTSVLVRYAEFVICHASTSVGYAVLHRKPLWTIYTDEMHSLYKQNYMQSIWALSKYLRVPSFNVSQIEEAAIPELEKPKEDRFAAYERDFLVTLGIEGGQSKKVFLREILALSN